MDQYLLGIDIGTTGIKAGLLNVQSKKLDYSVSNNYARSIARSEYDADDLWNNTLVVIDQVVSSLGKNREISGIGITGQMHGAVLYDSNGQIIDRLINWQDEKRCDKRIIEKVNSMIDADATQSIGTKMACGYTGAILLWIKQHEPEKFQRIHHFVLFTDFIRSKLLGRNDYATDPTNAFGTGLFNTRLNHWHNELIDSLELPADIFPQVHPSTDVAGTLSDEIANSLHVKKSIPIIYGGGDNQTSMLGSGLTSPNSPTLINIGTAAQVSKVNSFFQKFPGVDTRPFFDDRFALVGTSLGGGGHYQRLRDKLKTDYLTLDDLAAQVPAGAGGLYYCTGPSRTDPNRAEGFFGNLQQQSDPGYKARAVMEGVLMDLYESLVLIEQVNPRQALIGAGKALQVSKIWTQIAADLFAKSIRITKAENALLGAALLAGIGTKQFDGPDDCTSAFEYEPENLPNDSNARFYREQFITEWSEQVKYQ
jgi:xylulokinase